MLRMQHMRIGIHVIINKIIQTFLDRLCKLTKTREIGNGGENEKDTINLQFLRD